MISYFAISVFDVGHAFFDKQWVKIVFMQCTTILLVLPLALQKDMSKMRFSTVLGISCLAVVSVVILSELYSYLSYNLDQPDVKINVYDITVGFTHDLKFFSGFATIFFSYSCHYGAFPVYNMLGNNNDRRIKKVLRRSIILDASFYLIVGISGYLTWPRDTPALIIERKALDGSKDIVMSICRIFVAGMLICKIPVNYNSLRQSAFNLIFKDIEVTTRR